MRGQTYIIKNSPIRKSLLKTDISNGIKRKSHISYYKVDLDEIK